MEVYGAWAIAFGLISIAAVWLIKTPKESARDIESRVKAAELDHRKLEADFIRSSVALTTKVETLSGDVRDLTKAVRALTSRMDQNGFREADAR